MYCTSPLSKADLSPEAKGDCASANRKSRPARARWIGSAMSLVWKIIGSRAHMRTCEPGKEVRVVEAAGAKDGGRRRLSLGGVAGGADEQARDQGEQGRGARGGPAPPSAP